MCVCVCVYARERTCVRQPLRLRSLSCVGAPTPRGSGALGNSAFCSSAEASKDEGSSEVVSLVTIKPARAEALVHVFGDGLETARGPAAEPERLR